jgi:hypothetical protein
LPAVQIETATSPEEDIVYENGETLASQLVGEGEAAVLATAQVDHERIRRTGPVSYFLLAEKLEIAMVVQGQYARQRSWHTGGAQEPGLRAGPVTDRPGDLFADYAVAAPGGIDTRAGGGPVVGKAQNLAYT